MILRNPVDRAFAQHVHMLSFADAPITFRRHMDAALASESTRIGELYPFLEFGLYAKQVERYFSLFPRDRISVHFYEDYLSDPARMMQQIFQFLQVDPAFTPDMTERHMQARIPKSWAAKRLLKRFGLWDLARALAPKGLKKMAVQNRSELKLNPEDRARPHASNPAE